MIIASKNVEGRKEYKTWKNSIKMLTDFVQGTENY